ncbi:MAG: right-handed parallel beta-helix repeat-containing protein [Candidatus Cloacimonetes bacterium]|nr:right-handed parallel beta-helix repeat-containing protein [Candidatus Cloacimonadota bacterium]
MFKNTILLLIIIIFSCLAMAEIIEVSGDQSGVWENANTYLVIEDVHVNDGDTLIIERATTVMFMDRYIIEVSGILLAQGTIADSILFTYDLTNPDEDEWESVQFHGSQSSGSIMSHCIFEYGFTPISCWNNANILIADNTFRNSHTGITTQFAAPLIQNNNFHDLLWGVHSYDASACIHVRRNVFTNMLYDGIFFQIIDSCIIEDNLILNYGNEGIACSHGDCLIRNNVLQGAWAGIHCRNLSGQITDNLIMNNTNGIIAGENYHPEIVNNTIVECKYGLNIDEDIENIEIINNIFYDNYVALHLELPESYVFSHNLFWSNTYYFDEDEIPDLGNICMYNNNGTPCDPYYDIFVDPQFDDPGLDYFTLQQYSPAIDAGNPAPEYNDPDGTIADMGAYYFPQSFQIPVAAFTSNVYFGAPPLTVSFQSESSGDIDVFLWDFGDDSTSTEENPVHEYIETGEYDVTLTLTGPGGTDSCEEENYIMVMPEIEVSGNLQGDWSSDFCYCITGNSSIVQNTTLSIEAGTLIRFMGLYTLTVSGSLLAVGTETDSIRFTSGNRHPFEGDWASISFITSQAENSIISHVIVEYAEVGVFIQYTPLRLSSSRISDNYYGIELVEADPIIENCFFTSNYEYGIKIHESSSGTISNNTFYKNDTDIMIYSSIPPLITGNTFTEAEDRAIKFSGGYAEISYNQFFENPYGIVLHDCFTQIHHNLFCGTGIYGIWIFGECGNSPIYNNTFCNLQYGIRSLNSTDYPLKNNIFFGNEYGLYSDPGTSDLDHNLFYNNYIDFGGGAPNWFAVTDYSNANNDPCDLNYNLFMSPEFVDPQLRDFNLTEISPCIDAGNPDPQYFDPDDTISDIGAFYFHHIVDDDNHNISTPPLSCNLFPNPFNPETTINFMLTEPGNVKLNIYNIKGQKVTELLDELKEPGKYSITWNAENLCSGLYFIKLSQGSYSIIRKTILLK